jgi:thiol-disulfide isomerase/thioredoxin
MGRLIILAVIAPFLIGCGKEKPAAEAGISAPAEALQHAVNENPRVRFEALRKEYVNAREAFSHAQREAGNDETMLKALAERRDQMMAYASRFFALAQQFPGDSVAFDALAAVVEERFQMEDEVRALGELVCGYAGDPRIAHLCGRMRYLNRTPAGAAAEQMLRDVVAKSPHPNVRAQAQFSLAELVEDWAQFSRYFRRHPDEASQPLFHAILGEKGVAKLRDGDAGKMEEKATQLYEQVLGQPAGPRDGLGSLADQAKGRLFAIRNLGIGAVVPELDGVGLDGKPLKLSDFRGKVVVLTFWATWCGPCMGMVPRERALVERLRGQPFALIGVNCDKDGDAAARASAREQITWPSFADGDPATGPIVGRWGVHSWPTVYVLDEKGVVRFKNVDFPNKDRFEDEVDILLREMPAWPQR